MNIDPMQIDPSALAYLARQPWPGNVRELLNVMRRLTVFSNGKTIDLKLIRTVNDDLAAPEINAQAAVWDMCYKDAKKEALDIFSREYLTSLFKETRGNISEASRRSGLERASIQKIIKRLDMDMSQFRD